MAFWIISKSQTDQKRSNIMEYTVVEVYGYAEELIRNVNDLIKDGWRPLGGVAIGITETDELDGYFQAMIRD